MREKRKIWESRMVTLGILFLLLFIRTPMFVHADENRDISEFIGRYLCDTPEMEEYANPDVIELYFNDDGNLMRYSGLFYGTAGTSIMYTYTDYEINGDTLTCYYDGAFSPYGPLEDISAGTHEYVMDTDGNIASEGHIWYRYLTEEERQAHSRVLMNVEVTDFMEKNYSEMAAFLGIQELSRGDIEKITFLDTLDQKPENAWDVSQDKDGSVYAWLDLNEGISNLYIAANGGVIANTDSENLFRACLNLKRINFNNCFDTSKVKSMEYMFADCKNLQEIAGIGELNTAAVETMEGIFSNCTNLTQLNISSWDTDNCWTFDKMFYNCAGLADIDVDNLHLTGSSYNDIFVGTVREGDNPMLSKERNKKVVVSYILDTTGFSFLSDPLRARVANSYDDVLKNLDNSGADVRNIMYAIKDINGDGIPEMLIKQISSEMYTYYAYTYNAEQGRVNYVSGFNVNSSGSSLVFFSEGYTLAVYKDESYYLYSWQGDQFTETSVMSTSEFLDMRNGETVSFRYVYPELLDMKTVDSSIDEDKTYELKMYGEKGESGYVSATLYIDKHYVFTGTPDNEISEADISGYIMTDDTIWLGISLSTDTGHDYSGIIRYKDDTGNEIMNLRDAVDKLQLVPYSRENYFELKSEKAQGADVSLQFHLDTISYGSDFSFSMDYQYTDGKLVQKEYLRDIENISEKVFTLSTDKDVFDGIASKEVKYTAKAGSELMPDKMWISDGIIWIRVKNEEGESGWVPMGAFTDYLELSYSYGASVTEQVEANKDNPIYYGDFMIPDGDVLYRLGNQCYGNSEYENAIIYCSLIKSSDEYYSSAQNVSAGAKEKLFTIFMEQIEQYCNEGNYSDAYEILIMQKEVLNEDESYQQYLDLCKVNLGISDSDGSEETAAESNLEGAVTDLLQNLQNANLNEERPLAYCSVDLNNDGDAEIIVRSFKADATEGGAYIYSIFQYDHETGKYKHLKYADFSSWAFDGAVHFWEDKGYLVIDCSTGEYYFEIISLDGASLKTEYDTSSDMSYLPKLEFESLDLAAREEMELYKTFLSGGEYLEDMQELENVTYGIYDLDHDGVFELILKGLIGDGKYQYWFYTCVDGELEPVDVFENWQNGGNGELYITGENKEFVVNSRFAGSEHYTAYDYDLQDGVTEQYIVTRVETDKLNDEGKYEQVTVYSFKDLKVENGDKVSTEEEWNSFMTSLIELPFYYVPWRALNI